ncbi:MAG: DUF4350 domain-containing protein [Pirellulaceae bacterium]
MSTAVQTAAAPSATPTARRPAWLWPVLGIVAALLLVSIGYALTRGSADETLPTAYGKRRGSEMARSVNGTGVLAEMFKAAGHRVTTFNRLSPRLDGFDFIVWAPDDFAPPTPEQREFLEDWLAGGEGGRIVFYIGRDYDAAVAYWSEVRPLAAPEDAPEFQRRLARAKADYRSERAKMPTKAYARWFTAKRDGQPRQVRTLQGPWSEGIDAAQTEITIEGRLDIPVPADKVPADPEIPANFEPLLRSEGDLLVTRVTDPAWTDGQVIVLVNGSFVLNYPLVNHEHRKLAARLVNEAGAPGKVVFIESGPGGPEVLDKEPSGGDSSPLAFMGVWPLNAILLHVIILGIVFCLARSPIFGRPRELPAEPAADFGKHVAALGELLARTQDRNYAQARLAQYRALAKRDSGKSHLKAQ